MRYILNIPNRGRIEFPEYKDAIFALGFHRAGIDHITMDEVDDEGNVVGHLGNEELRKVVADLDALAAGTVLLGKPGRTL